MTSIEWFAKQDTQDGEIQSTAEKKGE